MWSLIVTCSYLVIGFVTFKISYHIQRGNDLALLEVRRFEYDKASTESRKHPYEKDYHKHMAAMNAHNKAERLLRAQESHVKDNSALSMTSFMGALWPITLVVLAAIGFWKIFRLVTFRGDLDRGPRKRAQKLIAVKREQFDRERKEAELMELAKTEGLIGEEELRNAE